MGSPASYGGRNVDLACTSRPARCALLARTTVARGAGCGWMADVVADRAGLCTGTDGNCGRCLGGASGSYWSESAPRRALAEPPLSIHDLALGAVAAGAVDVRLGNEADAGAVEQLVGRLPITRCDRFRGQPAQQRAIDLASPNTRIARAEKRDDLRLPQAPTPSSTMTQTFPAATAPHPGPAVPRVAASGCA